MDMRTSPCEGLKAEVLPDIMRRLSAARPEELTLEPCIEKMRYIAGEAFDHALNMALICHREHPRDIIPYDRNIEKLKGDEVTLAYIGGQDAASQHMLESEHRMTLIGFFIVIGISREAAQRIVDELILVPTPNPNPA
jgi:hypothetical protein